MSAEWEPLYEKALQEHDGVKLAAACEQARHAINDRLTSLAGQSMALEEERERLYEALRTLLIHEYKLEPPS
ncbi:MAG: hypothetical protein WAL71_09530 [Terriglobales bacterium]|jgi:hypothetical protein